MPAFTGAILDVLIRSLDVSSTRTRGFTCRRHRSWWQDYRQGLPCTRGFTDVPAVPMRSLCLPVRGVHRLHDVDDLLDGLPRTRGFTWSVLLDLLSVVSSPCAGVHPIVQRGYVPISAVSSPCAGVHRCRAGALPGRALYLPRTRGFTASRISCCVIERCVFPVRGGSPVGIDLWRLRQPCLPRTRGFTGLDGCGRSRIPMCLPRARGFTGVSDANCRSACSSPYAGVHRRAGRCIDAVSSPCAGVHRYPVAASLVYLPRARGFTERLMLIGPSPCIFPVRGGSPTDEHSAP